MTKAVVTQFVDVHHHFWDLERHRYDWLSGEGWPEETEVIGDYHAIRRTYLPEDLVRDAAGSGLTQTVHVQADWSGPDPVDETRWLQSLADETGLPTAIVGYADLADPAIEEILAAHAASPNFRGIRSTPDDTRPDDASFRRGIAALEKASLSYDLRGTPDNAADTARLAADFGGLSFIVGHTGEPRGRTDEDRAAWRLAMRRLAEPPNVAVKISGLGMRDHAWTVESIRPWILETIDIFGVDRCMFGTNWPVDGLYSTYRDLVAAYRMVVAPFSLAEQHALLAANAERLYRI